MSRGDQRDRVQAAIEEAIGDACPFAAETGLARALRLARTGKALDLMPGICTQLSERRLARRAEAIATETLYVVEDPFDDEAEVRPGVYLLRPPLLVGADARRLRMMAMEQRVAVFPVCHEPVTAMGLCPVVAIAPGATIRTKVRPPAGDVEDGPLIEWIGSTFDALGDAAVDSIDSALAAVKRLDQLLDRLDAIPEHAGLHQAVAAVTDEAATELAEEEAAGGRRRRSRKAG